MAPRRYELATMGAFDVAAAAAARSFFSKMLDATGTPPDPVFKEKIPGLVDVLSVGRRIEPE